MELQINSGSQAFVIPTEVDSVDELASAFEAGLAEEETAFPLLLFETNKPLFDLGMATWFRLLAADVKE